MNNVLKHSRKLQRHASLNRLTVAQVPGSMKWTHGGGGADEA